MFSLGRYSRSLPPWVCFINWNVAFVKAIHFSYYAQTGGYCASSHKMVWSFTCQIFSWSTKRNIISQDSKWEVVKFILMISGSHDLRCEPLTSCLSSYTHKLRESSQRIFLESKFTIFHWIQMKAAFQSIILTSLY